MSSPKEMLVDQFQDYLYELVGGIKPCEMERDNSGQLMIYTGVYQWADGTLHDEAEPSPSDNDEQAGFVAHNHFGEVFMPDTCPACAKLKSNG